MWRSAAGVCLAAAATASTVVAEAADELASSTESSAAEPSNETLQAFAEAQRSCPAGLILPVWEGTDISWQGRAFRGFVYFLALLYLFLGVSIISDRFMGAIEVITSQEREVVVNKKGERKTMLVRVWNETVANLTLMALGSSAPEIMLSVIEIWAEDFQAGDLGPGTIVGSAAYNLFVIIAICICVIPKGEVRKIKQLSVFFVTATWSIFAYIWLYLILAVISEGVVEVWEGILTFLFFPITVLTAFIADKKDTIMKIPMKLLAHKWRPAGSRAAEGDLELARPEEEESEDLVEQARNQSTLILRELRDRYPDKSMAELTALAQEKLAASASKSRAFYRIQATRNLTGGSISVKRPDVRQVITPVDEGPQATRVQFAESEHTVLENVGAFPVRVVLQGPAPEVPILVDYRSEDGTANAGSDYIAVSGTLLFRPGQREQFFKVKILDDDVFEEDEHFWVHLVGARDQETGAPVALGEPASTKIWILDDDHGGSFTFPETPVDVPETVGEYAVVVERRTGARGRVDLPYSTKDGTALAGQDYLPSQGVLRFDDNESKKVIPLKIISKNSYERNVSFTITLEAPILINGETDRPIAPTSEDGPPEEGRPVLGEFPCLQINIRESLEFKDTVDKLVESRSTPAVIVGTTSWQEQFAEAVKLTPDCDEEGGSPSLLDWIMHYLAFFWKVIFAFVPPTDMVHGWICFWVSITCIGVLTAVIRDLASAFGCFVGIKDAVTAISIVALGTSLPDTFASKVSAIGDDTADNSVGNVTGSNAVNVFLGIGVAWSIAALYHEYHGEKFHVPPGNLAFSVTLFCSEAVVAIIIIVSRRSKYVGGELGGPVSIKYVTSSILISLWLFYVTMSTLEVYDVIEGF